MADAMDAEFDTVAMWTAEVVDALGPEYALPAGCRGSGSPESGACRAARRLFDRPSVRADAAALPLPDAAVRRAWCLGVICTLPDQPAGMRELRRILEPGGLLGLLVFSALEPTTEHAPEGNHFPTEDELRGLLAGARLEVVTRAGLAALGTDEPDWDERMATVERELARRHADDPRWQVASRQSDAIGRLLASGAVTGQLLVVAAG